MNNFNVLVSAYHLILIGKSPAEVIEGVAEIGVTKGEVCGCLRFALTGKEVSPPIDKVMETLGRERCLERIKRVIYLEGCRGV